MEIVVTAEERRAVHQWLQEGRKATGLAALPEEKRRQAAQRNAKLRQRVQTQRKS